MREPDRTILAILRQHPVGGDIETIVNGYMPMQDKQAVSRALQRLKRHGLVVNDRRWWAATGVAS